MTTPIGPLGPVAGSVLIAEPEASPELRHGDTVDPAHGQWEWEDPFRPAWVMTDYGNPAEGQAPIRNPDMLGQIPATLPASSDLTLYGAPTETGSHAGPWPAFGLADGAVNDREAAAARLVENQDIHAADLGDSDIRNHGGIEPTTKMPWRDEADYVTAGQTILQPVPGQLEGQMGRDRVQGTPPLNHYGFDSAHVNRPRAVGDVPGNFLWLDGRSQRPMVIQPRGRSGGWPTGPGSPFEGQDAGQGSTVGAVLTGLPSEYVAPAQPPTGTPPPASSDDVWSSW